MARHKIVGWALTSPERAKRLAVGVGAVGIIALGGMVTAAVKSIPGDPREECGRATEGFAHAFIDADRSDSVVWSAEVSKWSTEPIDLDPSIVPTGPATVKTVGVERGVCYATIKTPDVGIEVILVESQRDGWKARSWGPISEED